MENIYQQTNKQVQALSKRIDSKKKGTLFRKHTQETIALISTFIFMTTET